jgi:archaemetzincin
MGSIRIGWIGEGAPDRALLAHVGKHVARAFRAAVETFEAPGAPRHAFDPKRSQHSSGEILKWLLPLAPEGGKVLGVTDRDLFIPILTYVFGEAQLGGAAAVISTARLGDELDLFGPRVVRERLAKEAVHELGHCFGLRHCQTPGCVMGRSASVRDVDEKGSGLCSDCRGRIAGL